MKVKNLIELDALQRAWMGQLPLIVAIFAVTQGGKGQMDIGEAVDDALDVVRLLTEEIELEEPI
jgi:hypothetical protein